MLLLLLVFVVVYCSLFVVCCSLLVFPALFLVRCLCIVYCWLLVVWLLVDWLIGCWLLHQNITIHSVVVAVVRYKKNRASDFILKKDSVVNKFLYCV